MFLAKRMATVLLTAVLGIGVVSAAELKIGYIDSEEIFQKYEGTKAAQEKFNKEVAKWEQKASEMQKEIMELRQQLEKQSLLLSSERKKELESQLQEKMVAYQKYVQSKFGQEGTAMQKNSELTKPIVEKINKIIERIAEQEKYDFIFDARAGGIVFAKKGYDLTARVLDLLSKE
jgi:outer membrane protein